MIFNEEFGVIYCLLKFWFVYMGYNELIIVQEFYIFWELFLSVVFREFNNKI